MTLMHDNSVNNCNIIKSSTIIFTYKIDDKVIRTSLLLKIDAMLWNVTLFETICDGHYLYNFLIILNKIYFGMSVIDLGDSRFVNMLIISGWKYLSHSFSLGIVHDYARYNYVHDIHNGLKQFFSEMGQRLFVPYLLILE